MLRPKYSKGEKVIIDDIHPQDVHFSKKDLFISKEAFILAPPDPRWIRNKYLREWDSIALSINGEIYWFHAVKLIKTDNYED